jgi:hypothetical protein
MNATTTYFSAEQKRILKSLWLPATIATIWTALMHLLIYGSNRENGITHELLYFLGYADIVLIFSWESIIKRTYRKTLFIVLTLFAVDIAMYFIRKLYGVQLLKFTMLDATLMDTINVIIKTIICVGLTGKRKYWLIGLVTGFIMQGAIGGGYQLLSFIDGRIFYRISSFFDGKVNLFMLLSVFLVSFTYYGWLYLVENWYNIPDYRKFLRSKIQVISGKEYLLLFFMTAWTCWGTMIQIAMVAERTYKRDSYDNSYESLSSIIFSIFLNLALFIVAGYLLRNISGSRMMTAQNDNGWLYSLHFLPILNIIPWIVLGTAVTVNDTREKNAVFYLTKERSSITYVIIILGVVLALTGFIYQVSGRGMALESSAAAIILIFYIGKIFSYLTLFKSRNVVFLLISLNILWALVLLASGPWDIGLYFLQIMLSYLSCYLMLEMFQPALSGEDAMAAPQEYREPGEEIEIG